MQIDRGVVRLGAEIEVAEWTPGCSYQKTAQKLLDSGYMVGDAKLWQEYHTYHCTCEKGGCKLVKRGQLIVPPLVSMTYDATLPVTGAEFVMSPVLLADEGMPHFEKVWKTVTQDAVWSRNAKDIKGRTASPSVHLHVSATLLNSDARSNFDADVLHALSMFSPEFFLLADVADVRRGVAYRLPERGIMQTTHDGIHHGFIQVRQAVRNAIIYIEWRLFEAAYNDWNYIESCAYVAAGLTRGLLEDAVFSDLMTAGYNHMYDRRQLEKAVLNDDVAIVLGEVSMTRLNALREICLRSLDDDHYGSTLVDRLFERAVQAL